ncbi:MAG: hypothetical protein OXU86_06745 [Thaumarchaeota archaeon]|nr:hypothetical protein [Nitrososphaerota archaeon]
MIISPSAVNLGYILRSIPHSSFKMDTFNDRLRLQKLVYMVEAFGVYLGYDYSWYLRGPYCTSLARAGFELEQIASEIPPHAKAEFMYSETQKKFKRATRFIRSIMDDPDDLTRLEIASSLHLLVVTTNMAKPDIISRVISKMSGLDINRDFLSRSCEDMWRKLCKEDLIPDERK